MEGELGVWIRGSPCLPIELEPATSLTPWLGAEAPLTMESTSSAMSQWGGSKGLVSRVGPKRLKSSRLGRARGHALQEELRCKTKGGRGIESEWIDGRSSSGPISDGDGKEARGNGIRRFEGD